MGEKGGGDQEDISAFLSPMRMRVPGVPGELIPNIDAATIVGVRTPELRKFAKARREDAGSFWRRCTAPSRRISCTRSSSPRSATSISSSARSSASSPSSTTGPPATSCPVAARREPGCRAGESASVAGKRPRVHGALRHRRAHGAVPRRAVPAGVLRVGHRRLAPGVLREHDAGVVLRRGAGGSRPLPRRSSPPAPSTSDPQQGHPEGRGEPPHPRRAEGTCLRALRRRA